MTKKPKMTPVSKGHKPKGKRGMASVKRLGRNKATGNFDTIATSAGAKYHSAAVGRKIAGAIYWNKVKKRLYGK